MSGSVRLLLTILAAVFIGYFAIKIVLVVLAGFVHALFALVFPLLVVGVVAVVLYTIINRKSLGGGRRTLP
jgi:hypothetical protein